MEMMSLISVLISVSIAQVCFATFVINMNVGRQITTDSGTYNCTDIGQKNITTYSRWPFHFTCKDQVTYFRRIVFGNYDSIYKNDNVTCSLIDSNGTKQWDKIAIASNMKKGKGIIYEDFDAPDNDVSTYRLVFHAPTANYCSFQDITLHSKKFAENFTCQNLSQEIGVIDKSLKIGNVHRMFCSVDYSVEPTLYFQDLSKAEYKWTRNCSDELPANAEVNGNTLTLKEANFQTGGVYSCTVKYKGMERFVTNHEVCIQHGNAGTYSIKCPKEVKVKVGSDVNITCSVDFGTGLHLWLTPTAFWTKQLSNGTDMDYCQKFTILGGPVNSTVDERANCDNFQITDLYKRCFMYDPSPEIKEALKHLVGLTLVIREMKESDVGSYRVLFQVGNDKRANHTIELLIDQEEELQNYAHQIGFGILGLILLLLIIGICIWRKNDILWFGKKYFGPYEREVKKYTLYLAYHFSTENMTETSQRLTNELIVALYKKFDDLNATIYDDHKDGNEMQLQIENISKLQNACHSIVIILNREYVTDNWSLHKAYVALRNMIEGGTKIIFISLPGVEKYFEELPNEPKTALKHAMKMNTTIKWNGKLPLSGSLHRRLEYALPKCKKQNEKKPGTPEKIEMEVRRV